MDCWEGYGNSLAGKVERNETHAEALKREIMEELGINISVGEKIGVFRHAYTHCRVTVYVHFCEIPSGEPQAIQSSEIRWMNISTLKKPAYGKSGSPNFEYAG